MNTKETWNTTCPDFVQKQKTPENGLMVKGVTLLTTEEAERLPEETLAIGYDWWLRSPGNDSFSAATVDSYGSVYYNGDAVHNIYGAVRPALIVDLESSNLTIGDRFRFGEKEFEIISADRALCTCTESIERCAFRTNWQAKDANDYESSDVKKFVDRWYQNIIHQLSQPVQKKNNKTENIVCLKNGLKITGVTLLTAEEAKKLPKETLAIGYWWWLRSPGRKRSNCAAVVLSDGSVSYPGSYVDDHCAIRPSLVISNLKSSDLQIGDVFRFGEKEFEIISGTRALCTGSIGGGLFRKDWQAEDANDYEMSDVKKIVDGWYIQAMEKETEGESKQKWISRIPTGKPVGLVTQPGVSSLSEAREGGTTLRENV